MQVAAENQSDIAESFDVEAVPCLVIIRVSASVVETVGSVD